MSRSLPIVILMSCTLGGCLSAAPPKPLTPTEQKLSDQLVRPMFARLIAGHRKYGATNLFSGRREYVNAQVSGPEPEENALGGSPKRICAKVLIKNAFIGMDRQVDLSASVAEGSGRLNLRMTDAEDLLGPRCKGPYVPFPELEAITRKAS